MQIFQIFHQDGPIETGILSIPSLRGLLDFSVEILPAE